MAKVIQIIATDRRNPYFEPQTVTDDWHAVSSIDAPRTVCGYQLEGDDGTGPGPEREGRVTCPTCRKIIEEIQAIEGWR